LSFAQPGQCMSLSGVAYGEQRCDHVVLRLHILGDGGRRESARNDERQRERRGSEIPRASSLLLPVTVHRRSPSSERSRGLVPRRAGVAPHPNVSWGLGYMRESP
jgi:hypothetical protein